MIRVNVALSLSSKHVTFPLPIITLGENVCWNLDVFLTYPSPLTRAEYPQYAQSDLYQGAELFKFIAKRRELEDRSVNSAPAHIGWTRISQWLPWMAMGKHAGSLVYSCMGYKLQHGYADLPENLRQFVEQSQPKFCSAPEQYTTPNETSWTYFKKIADRGDYPAVRQ